MCSPGRGCREGAASGTRRDPGPGWGRAGGGRVRGSGVPPDADRLLAARGCSRALGACGLARPPQVGSRGVLGLPNRGWPGGPPGLLPQALHKAPSRLFSPGPQANPQNLS